MNRTLKYEMKRKQIKADSEGIKRLLGEVMRQASLILIYLDNVEKDKDFNEMCHEKIREIRGR